MEHDAHREGDDPDHPRRGDSSRITATIAAALGLALSIGVLTALAVPAVRESVGEATIAPLPGFVPGAVDALVAVVNGVRWVAPFTAAAGLALFFASRLGTARDRRRALLVRLSRVEYSGVDQVAASRAHGGRVVAALRESLRGTGLAVLAVVLVGATSGIEHEVTNGPLRPIDALTDLVAGSVARPDGTGVSYVLQGPAVTFMDDSAVDADGMRRLVDEAPFTVVPFGKHLFNLDRASAIEVSVPDDVYAALTGRPEPPGCASRTVVVDDTVGKRPGESVTLNEVPLRVAGVLDGVAQMNRSVAVVADSTVRQCITPGRGDDVFGAVVLTDDIASVRTALADVDLDAAAVGAEDFRESNRDFWRANATPLLLQLILYLALFSGFAAAGERQSVLQRNIREIGMLNATGVDFATLASIERRRALSVTVRATVVAAPLMVPVAAAFNASELGVQIGVGAVEVAVGFSITLLAMLLASRRALSRFRRTLDLPLAVKG